MKRIFYFLLFCMTCCLGMHAQKRMVTVTDSLQNKKVVIEVHDTVINGQPQTDTLSVTTYGPASAVPESQLNHHAQQWSQVNYHLKNLDKLIVEVLGIVFVFGMPVLIIFIVFYFRHKRRKIEYELAEKIIASGQPLPDNFFQKENKKNLQSKGISNICLGIGLFIFLWSLTDEFGLGCIGLLIMFTGIGQVIIHRIQTDEAQENTYNKKNSLEDYRQILDPDKK